MAWGMIVLMVFVTAMFLLSWFFHANDESPNLVVAPTMAPTASPTWSSLPERVDWIIQNNVSDENALFKRNSPQAKAAAWWSYETEFRTALQRYILAVFYFAMGGEQWKACGRDQTNCAPAEQQPQNWLYHETSECRWIGVTCDASGAVVRLDFGTYRCLYICVWWEWGIDSILNS